MNYAEMEQEAIRRIRLDQTGEAWYRLIGRIGKAVGCLPDITASGNEHIAKKVEELKAAIEKRDADIAFLADRCNRAGSVSFEESSRDTGLSSNSIVAIAYGMKKLNEQCMPGDMWDLEACRRAWAKLPLHRKTPDASTAMARAEQLK